MIFKHLNLKRMRYLLENGLPPAVLLEFFKKNQKRLILAGMKLDSVPKEAVRALNQFINMPDKAAHIAHEWFIDRYPDLPEMTVEEVLSVFLLNEYGIKPIEDAKKVTECCRFILLNLLGREPSEKLVSYMKTPILNTNIATTELAKESQEISDIIPSAINIANNYEQAKLATITDSELIALIPVLDRIRFSDIREELKKRASNDELQERTLSEYISLVENYFPVEIKSDISIKNSNVFNEDDFDITDFQVFGVVTNVIEASRTVFIRVLGLLKDGTLYKLSIEQRKSLFPEHGDIIWLSRGHRKVLEKNEFGLFNIDLDSDWGGKGAQYFVKELQTQIFPVSLCEYSLKELSRVESWLSLNEFHLSTSGSYVLLSDNAILRPSFTSNLTLDFEKPMDLYSNAQIYVIEGDYYSPELGTPASRVDFSSPEAYFKKLIKSGLGDKLSLSREAQGALVEEFNAIKNGQNSHKIEEIITALDELLAKQSLFLELVAELERSPKVQNAIKEGIEKVVTEKTSQADALRNQIKQLEEKKVSLEKVTSREEEQIKKLRQGLSSEIKFTFEKAVQDGRKALSEIALFQAILPQQPSSKGVAVDSDHKSLGSLGGNYTITVMPPHKKSLEDQFRPLRFRTPQVARFFEALFDIYLLGLTPAFMGSGSRIFADAFANSFPVDSIVDLNIGPGAISVPELLDASTLLDPSKIFVVKNFDISPVSLYGHGLVDLCYKKFLTGTSELGVNAVVTYEDSGLGLNYPPSLDYSFAIIDVDSIEFEDETIDLEGFHESIRDGGAVDDFAKRALFNIIRTLKTFEGIDDAARFSRLCGFLRKVYFSRFVAEIDH